MTAPRSLVPRVLLAGLVLSAVGILPGQTAKPVDVLYVDSTRGKDSNAGSERRPFESISAALAALPDPLRDSVTIEVIGAHGSTGGVYMPENVLALSHRMAPGVDVQIIGRRDKSDNVPVLDWKRGRSMVDARAGTWRIENFRVGTYSTQQRRGVMVEGSAHVTLKDISFRLRSESDAGIYAHRGGRVSLRGTIRLNEHLHGEAPDESFCGIIATEHGVVRFVERDGASLDIGNGSLSASLYGCIALGSATARITSWGRQSNNFAVNNGGRIDVRNTDTTLCAKVEENTPIGPEHDGHILAEDAHIKIVGKNDCAIALQKASTFTCNDIELAGEFRKTIWASSGSMFVGRFLSDVRQVEAHTGAGVHIEAVKGDVLGPVIVSSGGVVSLPDRVEAALGD